MKNPRECFTLSNGVQIPCIGFGTWKIPDGDQTVSSVKKAISCGYRHIDTAAIYKNEKSVGKAIKECGIDRDQIFVTSKVWNTERGYDSTLKAFEKSLKDLGLDFLDLYLIHWPAVQKNDSDWQKTNSDTWRALEELYKSLKVRAIGVSNFMVHHLEALNQNAQVMPMVNQIELHIGYPQNETTKFCKKNYIAVEAWSPLGSGKILSNPILNDMACKYKVTAAQLCLKWCLINNTIPLPRSSNPKRTEQNIDIFNFEISESDIKILNSFEYIGGSGLNPDNVDF